MNFTVTLAQSPRATSDIFILTHEWHALLYNHLKSFFQFQPLLYINPTVPPIGRPTPKPFSFDGLVRAYCSHTVRVRLVGILLSRILHF